MTHKEKMTARRIRQLSRQRGFSAVSNSRLDGKLQFLTMGFVAQGKPEAVARSLAMQQIRGTLPPPGFVRTRPYNERSKYNKENTRGNR